MFEYDIYFHSFIIKQEHIYISTSLFLPIIHKMVQILNTFLIIIIIYCSDIRVVAQHFYVESSPASQWAIIICPLLGALKCKKNK